MCDVTKNWLAWLINLVLCRASSACATVIFIFSPVLFALSFFDRKKWETCNFCGFNLLFATNICCFLAARIVAKYCLFAVLQQFWPFVHICCYFVTLTWFPVFLLIKIDLTTSCSFFLCLFNAWSMFFLACFFVCMLCLFDLRYEFCSCDRISHVFLLLMIAALGGMSLFVNVTYGFCVWCIISRLPSCLPTCLPAYLPVLLLARLSACLLPALLLTCLSACLHSCLPALLLACLSACPPARLPACLPVCLPACLYYCSPVCLPASLPVLLIACRPACLFICTLARLPARSRACVVWFCSVGQSLTRSLNRSLTHLVCVVWSCRDRAVVSRGCVVRSCRSREIVPCVWLCHEVVS